MNLSLFDPSDGLTPDSPDDPRWVDDNASGRRVTRLFGDNRDREQRRNTPNRGFFPVHRMPPGDSRSRQSGPNQNYPDVGTTPALPPSTDLRAVGGRVLAVVDEDNLRISLLRHHNRKLSYRWLFGRLSRSANHLSAWAVLTSPPQDHRRSTYLSKRGWRVLDIPHETVETARGAEKKANADFDWAFAVGHLMTAQSYDTLLMGTGDGDLGSAVARDLHRFGFYPAVYVLAIPGATSARLRYADGRFITGSDNQWNENLR